MKIRRANHQDIEQVTEYGLNLLKQHSDLDSYFTPTKGVDEVYRKYLEESLFSEDQLLLVAETNGKLVAYALGEIQTRAQVFEITENGYINDVFVDEEFRQKGIANSLLKELKKWFESKNIQYIELTVHAKNGVGKKTWDQFGFDTYEMRERVNIKEFNIT